MHERYEVLVSQYFVAYDQYGHLVTELFIFFSRKLGKLQTSYCNILEECMEIRTSFSDPKENIPNLKCAPHGHEENKVRIPTTKTGARRETWAAQVGQR